jgi:hypothetical protein
MNQLFFGGRGTLMLEVARETQAAVIGFGERTLEIQPLAEITNTISVEMRA